jgi:hypothetical protein
MLSIFSVMLLEVYASEESTQDAISNLLIKRGFR